MKRIVIPSSIFPFPKKRDGARAERACANVTDIFHMSKTFCIQTPARSRDVLYFIFKGKRSL